MTSRTEFRPDWVSAPGETIADILAERELQIDDLARELGQTIDTVRALVDGRAMVTLATARALRQVLGGSVAFWMARDLQYRDDLLQLDETAKKWLGQLPLQEMVRFGWLWPWGDPAKDMLGACLRFFGVSSVRAWEESYANVQEAICFRTSKSLSSAPGAVAAWLRQGELQGKALDCGPWNPAAFEASLQRIRTLTRQKDPAIFLPRLQGICAGNGVAVSVVRAPAGCRASGATRFLSSGRALLLLSFRYLTDDQFWFTFFHEAGHLLLHGRQELFLEGTSEQSTEKETEANEFAARVLVPERCQPALRALPLNGRRIARFAKDVGVSSGVIVGQMQHTRTIRPSQMNNLKRRFRWLD